MDVFRKVRWFVQAVRGELALPHYLTQTLPTLLSRTRLESLFLRSFDDSTTLYTWTSVANKRPQPEVHAERPFIVGVDERLDSPDTATLKYEAAVARANGGEVRGVTPPGVVPMAAYAKPAPIHGEL